MTDANGRTLSEYSPHEEEFWESLRENNNSRIIDAVEKIVDWLRTNDFQLVFQPGKERVQLRIYFRVDGEQHECGFRINTRRRLQSGKAEVRVPYDAMTGRFSKRIAKYALQRKIVFQEKIPLIGSNHDNPSPTWNPPKYFDTGDSHFFIEDIADDLDPFFRVLAFFRDHHSTASPMPADWEYLTKYWETE